MTREEGDDDGSAVGDGEGKDDGINSDVVPDDSEKKTPDICFVIPFMKVTVHAVPSRPMAEDVTSSSNA
ncbi:hypothetical protein Sjap_015227 [Stephania japonica]|uniref:Uncharacterized protein n=1 Tax=Stephania japonica TaxID=461633 RepID=A0AAP0IJH9_9MAGN